MIRRVRESPANSASAPAETGDAARRATLLDPHTLMRIKNLQLRAKVVVEGFYNGLHRSPHHGFSVEFSEYRQYSPGDDLRYLDWRLYARSDRYYIRRFEDETNLRAYLLVDLSRSMGYTSGGYLKSEYAATLAASFAYFLSQQRDAVGLVTFAERILEYLPARHRPGHLRRLMLCLERSLSGASTDLAAPLERIAKTVPMRGLIVLISDLLAPIETLQTNLGYLKSRGHEVIVLRVLDPVEQSFDFGRPAMFRDMESGRDLYVEPERVRGEYLKRFGEHARAVVEACNALGVDYVEMTTRRPLELALFDFLRARLRRGRPTGRRASRAGRGA